MKKLASILLIFITASFAAQTVKNVDSETFKKNIEEKKGVLIDLRTTDEITRKGMIKGALQIDFLAKDAEDKITRLDRKKTYLIYCAGGGRSGDCATLMQQLGFKEVINLEKGFEEWRRKGFEVEKK